jgi:hypothetical protein
MHVPINIKSPNNISKWHMGFNSAFKGLKNVFVQHIENAVKFCYDVMKGLNILCRYKGVNQ